MDLTFRALHRHARIAPRKARYVMDMIRNKPINEALHILQFSNRRAARFIERVLKSAIANADEESLRRKIELDPNKLVVKEAVVDESTMFKRFKPRSRGMANPILKRNSHIRIALAPSADAEVRTVEEEAPGRKRGKKRAAAAAEAAEAAETSTATLDEEKTSPDETGAEEAGGSTTDETNDTEAKQ